MVGKLNRQHENKAVHSGSVGLTDPSKYNIAASLSFSPNDIKDDEREDLQEGIAEKLLDIRSL
jgi:hypothetical protein